VSFNNLSGNIPQNKQFATFLDDSFEGNNGLCGDQLSHKCLDHTRPSFSSSSADGDDDDSGSLFELDWKVVLIGYGSGFVVGVLGSTFYHKVIGWLKRVF
jgi:hypothetical protein